MRTLRAHHDRSFTINELAKVSDVPVMTTWRAVKDLKKLGLAKTRRIGNAVAVSAVDDRETARALRLLPDTDPHRSAAVAYARSLAAHKWLVECRLFGAVGRGEHVAGEEVDVAVIFDDEAISEDQVSELASAAADSIREKTNIAIVPLCISGSEMSRRGGLGSELRDKETIWSRRGGQR